MLQSYLHILRVFGLSGAEMASLLRTAQEEGCPGLRLLERDGEYAVCIQVAAPTRQMAHEHCEKWVQRLRPRFGSALFAEGEASLAQTALDALLRKRRLLVAADATTGRLLGDALSPLEHSEAAFDFGHETYADAERAKRIATPAVLLKKFPGDQLQATAGRAAAALQLSGADVAVAYMPASVGQVPFVLLCDRTGALARAVDPESSDALLANQMLDLVRRRVLGLPEAKGVIAFRPGHDRPLLPAFENGDYKESDTTRFSLRKPGAKNGAQRYEPMLDFDAPAAPKAGGITFEGEDAPAPAQAVRAPAVPPAPAKPAPAPHRQPEPSLLDEDIPDFTAPAPRRAAAPARPKPQHEEPDMQHAANLLYDRETLDDNEKAAARSRSLAKVERAELRQKILVITLLLLFLALLAGGGFLLWRHASNSLGRQPQARNYGTSRHDEQAAAYLTKAREKREGVLGYLAFPGMEGQLLYATREAADAASGESGETPPVLVSASYLGSAAPGHTVIDYRGTLPELFTLETLQENSGFTLYLPDATYRYKVMAVYELDLAQIEDNFNPATYGDLSGYYDYMAFTLGVRMRSQFETGVQPGQGASFLTLTALDTSNATMLCVTGRQLRETESAQLSPGAVRAAEQPLMPASYYAANGQEAPNAAALLEDQLQSYAADRSAIEEQASGNATNSDQLLSELGDAVADMQQQTSDLMNKADEMILLGLTDIAGESGAAESDLNQGAEGSLPEQEVEVPVTAEPTAEPDPVDGSSEGEQPTDEETPPAQSGAPSGGTSAEGETINVTMNGAAQTMDLVRCLAMVAQNELGPNAPMEAYKAQCVATHCWILSQGGYPSVLGAEPGADALAAAQEVAHVLVTYDGKVAFTPYFASASTGTASSADVWGGDRPYLQPVDSPYDKDVATHWNTNGATSGTARFARTTLLERFKEKLEIDLTDVDPNDWFHILSANAYGWVGRIQVGPDSGPNTSMRGTYFRETLLARQSVDGRSLRSQCFTVSYDAETDCFIFDVYGYGHGVGMSQWGAVGYARNGWSYDQILTHYFTGTTLTVYGA